MKTSDGSSQLQKRKTGSYRSLLTSIWSGDDFAHAPYCRVYNGIQPTVGSKLSLVFHHQKRLNLEQRAQRNCKLHVWKPLSPNTPHQHKQWGLARTVSGCAFKLKMRTRILKELENRYLLSDKLSSRLGWAGKCLSHREERTFTLAVTTRVPWWFHSLQKVRSTRHKQTGGPTTFGTAAASVRFSNVAEPTLSPPVRHAKNKP